MKYFLITLFKLSLSIWGKYGVFLSIGVGTSDNNFLKSGKIGILIWIASSFFQSLSFTTERMHPIGITHAPL